MIAPSMEFHIHTMLLKDRLLLPTTTKCHPVGRTPRASQLRLGMRLMTLLRHLLPKRWTMVLILRMMPSLKKICGHLMDFSLLVLHFSRVVLRLPAVVLLRKEPSKAVPRLPVVALPSRVLGLPLLAAHGRRPFVGRLTRCNGCLRLRHRHRLLSGRGSRVAHPRLLLSHRNRLRRPRLQLLPEALFLHLLLRRFRRLHPLLRRHRQKAVENLERRPPKAERAQNIVNLSTLIMEKALASPTKIATTTTRRSEPHVLMFHGSCSCMAFACGAAAVGALCFQQGSLGGGGYLHG